MRTFNNRYHVGDLAMKNNVTRKKILLSFLVVIGIAISSCSDDEQGQEDLLEMEDEQYEQQYEQGNQDQEEYSQEDLQENFEEENINIEGDDGVLAQAGEENLGNLDTVDYGNISIDEPTGSAESLTANIPVSSGGDSFSYTIVRGDWLSKISQRVYGRISDWPTIADANPQISNPDLIYYDNVITIPITNDQSRSFANSYVNNTPKVKDGSKKIYIVVKAGDTLGEIAQKVSGTSKNWKKIWEQNASTLENPDKLAVGQVLEFTPEMDAGTSSNSFATIN